jgi:hypothetical protein
VGSTFSNFGLTNDLERKHSLCEREFIVSIVSGTILHDPWEKGGQHFLFFRSLKYFLIQALQRFSLLFGVQKSRLVLDFFSDKTLRTSASIVCEWQLLKPIRVCCPLFFKNIASLHFTKLIIYRHVSWKYILQRNHFFFYEFPFCWSYRILYDLQM